MRFIIFLTLFIFSTGSLFSEKREVYFLDSSGAIIDKQTIDLNQNELIQKKPNPILKLFNKKRAGNTKLIAAILAFPFPFGIVGLHRIFLGTKPYVPVAYIASLGGVFGIIPLVDFFVILFDKDFEHYQNNGKVLMWVK